MGAFDAGMEHLKEYGLIQTLNKEVNERKKPILGICLGLQLFTEKSEEGKMPGLGWVEAKTKRFKFKEKDSSLRIPHMTWNTVKQLKKNILFPNTEDEQKFYFVHSFHLVCDKKEDILCTTHYGYDFVSVTQKDNIFGVQFHPKKSHRFGINLFVPLLRTLNNLKKK